MSKSAKAKAQLIAIALLFMVITVFSPLPMPLKYFLLFICAIVGDLDVLLKYIKEIKQTNRISDKKKLIFDILSLLISFFIISGVLREKILPLPL